MSLRTRYPLLLILTAIFAALTVVPAPAQPLRPLPDSGFDKNAEEHIPLRSKFIRSIRESQLFFAQVRHYRINYNLAFQQERYDRALTYADSLVHLSEHHAIPGVQLYLCYKNRAETLTIMQRDSEACVAYEQAATVINSAIQMEQDNVILDMQESYELDQMALDRALLTARNHELALIAVVLLLLAVMIGVGFIYASNRHTRRLQHELLRQMRSARQNEHKKTAFINSMCHEVRTPLNCVSGFAELLCDDNLTAEAHIQYCGIIRENRNQLRYIFDDMLEVAHLESLRTPLSHGYIDLCILCRTQLRTMKVRFPKPDVSYTDQIPIEEIGINANEKYLGILIGALLNNAYKFTKKGTIRLECGRDDDRVFIAVADTGCGIPPEQYNHVFERFTKLDTFSPGNGLGLYLCRLIARHMHGEIHIDPQYTGGVRIVATLPRK